MSKNITYRTRDLTLYITDNILCVWSQAYLYRAILEAQTQHDYQFVHSNWFRIVWWCIVAIATYIICKKPLFEYTSEKSGCCDTYLIQLKYSSDSGHN